MTYEEFWAKYNKENLLDIFDEICDFFSMELPEEFVENYDVGEIILETISKHESEKKFEQIIKFTDILKNKHPELYKEEFQYCDSTLIDYFCYKQDISKINKAFTLFLENPLQDIDLYMRTFKKLQYYQQSDLIKKVISENYNTIDNYENIIGTAIYELSFCKLFLTLQDICNKNESTLNRNEFSTLMKDFNFEFSDNLLSSYEIGFLKPQLTSHELNDMFMKDENHTIIIIEGYFLRYMQKKGFEFYLSGNIWGQMRIFWDEDDSINTVETYFQIDSEDFENYLQSIYSHFIFPRLHDLVEILWGSVYIYDFLHQNEIISDKVFYDFMETSKKLKGKVIADLYTDLWDANFIHSWEKPDCIAEIEFEEENKIFHKCFPYKQLEFPEFKSLVSEELSNIGELANYIMEGAEIINKSKNLLPDKKEKKVGRNEPCPCGSGKKYKKCCGK